MPNKNIHFTLFIIVYSIRILYFIKTYKLKVNLFSTTGFSFFIKLNLIAIVTFRYKDDIIVAFIRFVLSHITNKLGFINYVKSEYVSFLISAIYPIFDMHTFLDEFIHEFSTVKTGFRSIQSTVC